MATTVTRLLVAQQGNWIGLNNNVITQNKKFIKDGSAYKYYAVPFSGMAIVPDSNTIYAGMKIPITTYSNNVYRTNTISIATTQTYDWSSLQPFLVSNSTIQDNVQYDIKFNQGNNGIEFLESITDNTAQACSTLEHTVITGFEADFPPYPVAVGDEVTITRVITANVTYTTANKDYANNFNVADNLNVRARFLARVNFIPSYAGPVYSSLQISCRRASRTDTWYFSDPNVNYINSYSGPSGITFNTFSYGYGSFIL